MKARLISETYNGKTKFVNIPSSLFDIFSDDGLYNKVTDYILNATGYYKLPDEKLYIETKL